MISIVLLSPLARVALPSPAWLARALAWALALALGAVVSTLPANAEDAAPQLDAALVDQVRSLASGRVGGDDGRLAEGSGTPAGGTASPAQDAGQDAAESAEPVQPRIEVVIGQLDPRLRLAPCERIEPYLPPNVRLWGKSRVGLRCRQGPKAWNVYLPVTVKVWAQAPVVAAGAAAGSVLVDADLQDAEVDLAEEHTAVILDRRLLVGRTLAQTLKPGQAVRQGHIKLRQWFTAGDTVRVIVAGAGYALESEGRALTHGIEGQPARVRTESGRVVTGQPSGERRLEISL